MPFIILDRDGVINYDSDDYIKSPAEWIPIPGSLQAIAQLNQAGYQVLVATNQSGVARGYYNLQTLADIHAKLLHELSAVGGHVLEIFFCPHHPDEHCVCRKPQPGLLISMQKKYSLHFPDIFFIGDSWADVKAAQAVGCNPLLVLTGKGQQSLDRHPDISYVPHFVDLNAAVQYVLSSF